MVLPGPPENWSDTIRSYKREKSIAQFDTKEARVQKYVTNYEKTREAREFDPILGVYRDPSKEAAARAAEKREVVRAANIARDRDLVKRQTFDVINHTPLVKEEPKKPKKKGPPSTRVSYNILSNKDFKEHHFAAPKERPEVKEEAARLCMNFVSHKLEKREYDIVSNKYTKSHDSKDAVDKEVARRRAADRYWQTHDFNPVTCAHYDVQKERQFSEKRAADERAHGAGTKQFAKLPPTIQAAEGSAYDVVSGQPRYEELVGALASKEQKHAVRRVRHAVEARQVQERERLEALKHTHAMNRMADTRFKADTKKGYDVITGERYTGVGAKPLFTPATTTGMTSWDRIQRDKVRTLDDTKRKVVTGVVSSGKLRGTRRGGGGSITMHGAGGGSAPASVAGSVRTGGFD